MKNFLCNATLEQKKKRSVDSILVTHFKDIADVCVWGTSDVAALTTLPGSSGHMHKGLGS